MNSPKQWLLYLLECEDGTLYTGITNDILARFEAHCAGVAAKYTRSHPPRRILAARPYADRSRASKAEWQLKQLPRSRKLGFFERADLCHVADSAGEVVHEAPRPAA
jgi:putative endonuclease